MKRNFQLFRFIALLVTSAAFLVNCGGGGSSGSSSSSSTSASLSQTQAEAVAISLALDSGNTTYGVAQKEVYPDQGYSVKQVIEEKVLGSSSYTYSCNNAGCQWYYSISETTSCPRGGRSALTGSMSGTVGSSGTGSFSMTLIETITDNACYVTGLTFNGDPYISIIGTFNYLGGKPTTQRITISGGIKWGTTAAESIQIRLTANFTSNGHGTVSGTVGDHAVNRSF